MMGNMSRLLKTLLDGAEKPLRTVVGLMSGTSVDSIDVAICRIGPGPAPVRLLHFAERPFDPALKSRLTRVSDLKVRDIAELHVLVGEAFANACLVVLEDVGLNRDAVDLVGSHGQTVYHHSSIPGALRATFQLGDGDVIAEQLGLPVISDFRARDIASGGEGAPISPRADLVLYGASTFGSRRAILNLGGIANVTVLDSDPSLIFGFDTGPANALLDRAARRLTAGQWNYDRDGLIAREGIVNEALLSDWLRRDEFIQQAPPKSTGFEMYGDDFLNRAEALNGGLDANLMATLTEFTARSIAIAFDRHIQVDPPVDEIVVAGGGGANPILMARIVENLAPRRIRRSEDFGIPTSAREAMAFAILADMALRGEASSLPSVTGARHAAVLGKLSFP